MLRPRMPFFGLILGGLAWLVAAPSGTIQEFYVGTFTSEGAEGIYLCTFDPGSGDIALKEVFKGLENPNFLRVSDDGRFLYVASRPKQTPDGKGGLVSAFRIGTDGGLTPINAQSTGGDDPCYVDVSPDGAWAATANYGGGSISLFPVEKDGSLRPASSVVPHRGSGPNQSRQSAPHPHSMKFLRRDGMIYAADLGTDRVEAYRIEGSGGRLIPAPTASMTLPPGSGPRHFDFSAEGTYCYVVNELSSTVAVFEKQGGRFVQRQVLSALPEDFSGDSYCADIHLSPDGDMVYASNRGHNSIAIFRRGKDGRLAKPTHVSTRGDWPRNFTLDPSGKYMLVANQRSHNIAVFKLEDGLPAFADKELKLPAPVCLAFRKMTSGGT